MEPINAFNAQRDQEEEDMMGYDPFNDDTQPAAQPSVRASVSTECENTTPDLDASNDCIDKYIDRAYQTWKVSTAAPVEARRLTTPRANIEDMPNSRRKEAVS